MLKEVRLLYFGVILLTKKVEIYGHRGFSGCYPENTMISFSEAEAVGVDGIELDVQMTKDGEVVVIHDETLERTTNGIGFVKDMTYRELSSLDAGSWFDAKFSGEKIPALSEVLQWIKNLKRKLFVNIELKTYKIEYPNIEEKVLAIIDEHGLKDQVIISSFNLKSLEKVRQLDTNINTALLFIGVPTIVLEEARRLKVNGIHCEAVFAVSEEGRTAREYGYPIRVYTINDSNYFKTLKDAEVCTIMTDFPNEFIVN